MLLPKLDLKYCTEKEIEFLKRLAVYNIKAMDDKDDEGRERYEIVKM